MKLATRDDGQDGRLLLVSRGLSRTVEARAATTLHAALERWDEVAPALAAEYDAFHRAPSGAVPYESLALAAALPRSFQFLDASAFLAHNHILADAWGFARRTPADPPLIYQGLSDRFYPAHGEVPFRSTADNVDFEAEFGVIVDRVPLGVTPAEALGHVRLVVLLNDWSLRAFGPDEMRGGFGFIQAKPPSSMSALAVTPDELGTRWRDGRVCLPLSIDRNGERFGRPLGEAMTYGFGELIAHAAATRDLCAGTVVGSGTVSNFDAAAVGSGCIAERQALDRLAGASPVTPYLSFGERIRIEALDDDGCSIFGAIDQTVAAR